MPSETKKSLLLSLLVLLSLAGLITATIALEPPAGTLSGQVISERHRGPLINARVLVVIADEGQVFRKRTLTDASGRFRFPGIPADPSATYRLSVHCVGYYAETREDFVVPPDGTKELSPITLSPRPQELSLWTQDVVTRKEKPRVVLSGYLKGNRVHLAIYPFDPLPVLNRGTDPRQQALSTPWTKPVAELDVEITSTDSDGDFSRGVSLPVREPGSYLVVASSGNVRAKALLLISDVALAVKQSRDRLLVWATHLNTGRPAPGSEIRVRTRDRQVAAGETDDNGLFVADLPRTPARLAADEEALSYVVIARHGSSLSYVFSSFWWQDRPARCYIYTDRPIYRPSQQVFFKGILRQDRKGFYNVVAGQDVQVTIRDAADSPIYEKTLRTSRFGTFHDHLTLGEEPSLGSYRIIARIEGSEYYGYFEVAEYRKPEYKVAVTPSKAMALVGEKVQARIQATYYFGAPVANAKVTYNVYKSYYYSYPEEELEPWADYYEEDYSNYGYGEVILQGEALTDAQGMALVDIPTRREQEGGYDGDNENKYTIEVEVTDASMRSAKGTGSFIVAPGAFQIGIVGDYIVARPDEKVTLQLQARRFDGNPQANTGITLRLARWGWSEGEEEPEGKQPSAQALGQVVTDAKGKASFTFTPDRIGHFRVRAESQDEHGNPVKSSFYLWVAREGEDFPDYQGGSLEVVADKKIYERGDKAKLLITTTAKGAYALITIERDDIHNYQVIPIEGHSKLITVPIEDYFIPNMFVSVCIVREKDLLQREVRLNVAPKRRFLNVAIKPDKGLYRPGEEATYRIVTADTRGRPVSAEVSLAVVDEAIFALRPEVAKDIRKFFWGPRPNRVSTNFSFPDFYPGGADKFGAGTRVRKYFPDTAFWTADIVTDRRGRARVAFQMPDSLTTWRATARAITPGTLVGQQVQKVVVSKDLLVRLQTPRFFTQKDRLVVSALVHNYTWRDQEVKVKLVARGLDLLDEAVRSLKVPRQGIRQAAWHVRAARAGEAFLTVHSQGQTASDAMELAVPVLPHGIGRFERKAGPVEREISIPMKLPPEAIPETIRLSVRLTPTFVSAMLGTLDFLATYPFG